MRDLSRGVATGYLQVSHFGSGGWPLPRPPSWSDLGPVPEGADVAALAAWTVVSNVLLNLDELLMKP